MDATVTVSITIQEKELLEGQWGIGTVETWLQNTINNKILQRAKACIKEETELNPDKLTLTEMLEELSGIKLPTREDRDGNIEQ